MTPGARLAAAIEIIDTVAQGESAERALTRWARSSRYAGSKDRAAIRDHVFDVLRQWRSTAWLGGGETGRARVIGLLKGQGLDPAEFFTGDGYAPDDLSENDVGGAPIESAPIGVKRDVPDWLIPLYQDAFGDGMEDVLSLGQRRAPVFLRVNQRKATRDEAMAALARDDIQTKVAALSPTALEVTKNARRVAGSQAYNQGLVELQDVASQALVDFLPITNGQRVLDYCAGGGGKSLAMAARADLDLVAHDVSAARMTDVAPRALRAGVRIETTTTPEGKFDLVLCDAPCSGAGSWRRAPQAKWLLTPSRLSELAQLQHDILDAASGFVAPGGVLAYATCSVFSVENEEQVAAFIARHPDWNVTLSRLISPLDGGDGFFLALLEKPAA